MYFDYEFSGITPPFWGQLFRQESSFRVSPLVVIRFAFEQLKNFQ